MIKMKVKAMIKMKVMQVKKKDDDVLEEVSDKEDNTDDEEGKDDENDDNDGDDGVKKD